MQYKDLLTLLIEHHDLPHDAMLVAMRALMGGDWTPAQVLEDLRRTLSPR